MYILLFVYLITLFYAEVFQQWNNSSISIKSAPRFAYWFCFLIVLFVTIFRFDVGYDYLTYYENVLHPSDWLYHNWEPISVFFVKLCGFFQSPLLFFGIYGFAILFAIYKIIERYSISPFDSAIIFLSLYWLGSLSTMRQYLACAVLFWGIRYIRQKALLKYIICVIVACCSHYTAIIGIAIYFLYNIKNPRKMVYILLIGVLILIIALRPYLASIEIDKYQVYLDNMTEMNKGGSKIKLFYYALYAVSFIILYLKKGNTDIESFRYLAVITPSLAFVALLGAQTGFRLGSYFTLYYLLLYPRLFHLHMKTRWPAQVYLLVFCLYFILLLIVDANNDQGYTNYQFYFLKNLMQ